MRLPASCFQAPGSEQIPTIPLLLAPPWSNFVVHHNTYWSFFFFYQSELITQIRNCSVDTEPIDRVNCSEQEFCIYEISVEVNGTNAFPLLQDSKTQSTGAFEDKTIGLFESRYHFVGGAIPLSFLIMGIAIPLFFRSWAQKRPMSLQEFHGVIPNFFGIRETCFIIHFPLNVVEH